MRRKITYWGATGLVAIVALLAAFAYLTTAPQAVENFRHVGYPQQLRVLLGIAKLAARDLRGMGSTSVSHASHRRRGARHRYELTRAAGATD